MSDQSTDAGWFAGHTADDDLRAAIRTGTADAPTDWPTAAVNAGFADDTDDYYATPQEATIEAACEAVAKRKGFDGR
jgi:nucleolar protein 56